MFINDEVVISTKLKKHLSSVESLEEEEEEENQLEETRTLGEETLAIL